jgi:hypothetical protein
MRTTIQLILSVIIAVGHLRAAAPESPYTGRAAIDGLGTIAFPAGEWLLEAQSAQSAADTPPHREYFIFRRVGGALVERITFLRYPPKHSPLLSHMLDSITEGLGNGIPPEEHGSARRFWLDCLSHAA